MLLQHSALPIFLSLAFAAPLQSNDQDADLEARGLPYTSYSTYGINWDYATKECDPSQLAVLRQVAITTQDFLNFANYGYERGWAWSQYFLDVNPNGPNKNQGWKVNSDL